MKVEPRPWREIGEVRIGTDGKLVMPDPGVQPGVYRFRLAGDDTASVYIGESDDLRRRFAHYRNPGPSQRTNVRMNERMRARLTGGGTVLVRCAVNDKRCWFRDCEALGEPRPIFAHGHDLPAAVRLCDRHLSELVREPGCVGELIERPVP